MGRGQGRNAIKKGRQRPRPSRYDATLFSGTRFDPVPCAFPRQTASCDGTFLSPCPLQRSKVGLIAPPNQSELQPANLLLACRDKPARRWHVKAGPSSLPEGPDLYRQEDRKLGRDGLSPGMLIVIVLNADRFRSGHICSTVKVLSMCRAASPVLAIFVRPGNRTRPGYS
jgi:hypothetical protein